MDSTPYDPGIDLEERSEILETILEAIGVPFLVVDKDLRLLFFSAQAASLFRLRLSDIGENLDEVMLQDKGSTTSVAMALRERRVTYELLRSEAGREYTRRTQPLENEEGHFAGAVLTYIRRD